VNSRFKSWQEQYKHDWFSCVGFFSCFIFCVLFKSARSLRCNNCSPGQCQWGNQHLIWVALISCWKRFLRCALNPHLPPQTTSSSLLSSQWSSFPQQRKKAGPPHAGANTFHLHAHCFDSTEAWGWGDPGPPPAIQDPPKGLHWLWWHQDMTFMTRNSTGIFFLFSLGISVPAFRELIGTVCCSPPQSMVSVTK